MSIQSKFKYKVTACIGGDCPEKSRCKLFDNLSNQNIWEKIRPPYKVNSCALFEKK